MEAKNVMQTNAKFCEVFAFKISFFPLSTELCSALFIGHVSSLSFATPLIFQWSISSINHAHCILRLLIVSTTYAVVVEKSLYITFLIHKEQFAFQVQ